jgi:hypothetical protein
MLCRYFFHASDDRQISSEYNKADSDEDDDEVVDRRQSQPSREPGAGAEMPTITADIQDKAEPDVDPVLADWLRVDTSARPETAADDDSETEPESDTDSVGEDNDEWVNVEGSGSETLDSFHVLVSSSSSLSQQVDIFIRP